MDSWNSESESNEWGGEEGGREGGRHKRGKETEERKNENMSGSLQAFSLWYIIWHDGPPGKSASHVIVNAKIKPPGTNIKGL